MRDRLAELQQRAHDVSEATSENTNPVSEEGDDEDSTAVEVIQPQAVLFEEEPVIENFLSETKKIRDDITALETEVRSVSFFLLNSPKREKVHPAVILPAPLFREFGQVSIQISELSLCDVTKGQ